MTVRSRSLGDEFLLLAALLAIAVVPTLFPTWRVIYYTYFALLALATWWMHDGLVQLLKGRLGPQILSAVLGLSLVGWALWRNGIWSSQGGREGVLAPHDFALIASVFIGAGFFWAGLRAFYADFRSIAPQSQEDL